MHESSDLHQRHNISWLDRSQCKRVVTCNLTYDGGLAGRLTSNLERCSGETIPLHLIHQGSAVDTTQILTDCPTHEAERNVKPISFLIWDVLVLIQTCLSCRLSIPTMSPAWEFTDELRIEGNSKTTSPSKTGRS
jgi:hypothetical protein